ncbi:uncharacterized protein LOC123466331 [Daphnia magna]|uniref:uncharacterized protein LOC123466331 n=1 Tax=Daphnia magna TaxID=35525 RepID=UPI001E1BBF9A|nr:uncharacterized protein LOC123466331 [Daphnia magna]
MVAVQGLSKSTIHRLLKSDSVSDVTRSFKKTCHNRQVFNEQEECELTNYLIVAQKLNHGLTPSDTRKLAYFFAKSNNIKMPSRWEVNEEAGKDWFSSFLRRNSRLSTRKPERTSQARAAAVNHVVIDKYFDDLYDLHEKHKFTDEEIFNTDETNIPTVVDPQNIVAEKGVKAVILW